LKGLSPFKTYVSPSSLKERGTEGVRLINNPIKFGTDGWRGIIAQDFTFDNVRVCAQGVADYLKQSGLSSRGLVVGYDTRFASEGFASAVAEVIAGNPDTGDKLRRCGSKGGRGYRYNCQP
jgi:hypothetical protein